MVFVSNATNYHMKIRHSIFVKIYTNTTSGTDNHKIKKIETNFTLFIASSQIRNMILLSKNGQKYNFFVPTGFLIPDSTVVSYEVVSPTWDTFVGIAHIHLLEVDFRECSRPPSIYYTN